MDRLQRILEILDGSPNRMREKFFVTYHLDLFNQIIEFTNSIQDIPFKFRVWHWVNEINSLPKCECGKPVSRHIAWQDGYRRWCSAKCAANSHEVRCNAKKTLLERYGVDHYSKTSDYVDKVRQTSLQKWGVDNYAKTDDYVQKSKLTYQAKWGVDNFTKTSEYREKTRKTCLEKYGATSHTKTDDCKKAIKKSMLEKHGVDIVFKKEEFRKGHFKISNDEFYVKYLGDSISEFKCDSGLEHLFQIDTDNYFGRKIAGNKLCTVCIPISSSTSLKQQMLYDFISAHYTGEIISNYKDELEIDIYLPEKKIGFEMNGLYWHSDLMKDKDYHLNKTTYFNQKGIRLFHIWEDDWQFKREIIQSQLLNILGQSLQKIWARKCYVQEVGQKLAKKFLDNNHQLGYVRSDLKLGLFYGDTLVSFMSFDHYEGRKKIGDSEWNLNRFCNSLNTVVVGGASKLLKWFIDNKKPSRIISYADRDWSEGDLYLKLGFTEVNKSEPDYKYVDRHKRVHKSRMRKSRLGYSVTESEYTRSIGMLRVWDCGKIKFEKVI